MPDLFDLYSLLYLLYHFLYAVCLANHCIKPVVTCTDAIGPNNIMFIEQSLSLHPEEWQSKQPLGWTLIQNRSNVAKNSDEEELCLLLLGQATSCQLPLCVSIEELTKRRRFFLCCLLTLIVDLYAISRLERHHVSFACGEQIHKSSIKSQMSIKALFCACSEM